MDESNLIEFPSTEAEYEHWIEANPQGQVVNAHKTGAFPMYWHRADCGHIQPGSTHKVEGDYIKACSLNPGALAAWTKTRSEELNYCTHCRHKWLGEQQ